MGLRRCRPMNLKPLPRGAMTAPELRSNGSGRGWPPIRGPPWNIRPSHASGLVRTRHRISTPTPDPPGTGSSRLRHRPSGQTPAGPRHRQAGVIAIPSLRANAIPKADTKYPLSACFAASMNAGRGAACEVDFRRARVLVAAVPHCKHGVGGVGHAQSVGVDARARPDLERRGLGGDCFGHLQDFLGAASA